MIEVRMLDCKPSPGVLRIVKSQTGEALSEIMGKIGRGDVILESTYPLRYAESLPGLVSTVQSLISSGVSLEVRQVWEDGSSRLVDVGFLENLLHSRIITDAEDEEYIQHLAEAGSEDVTP